jgi:hypothetical protein
VLVVAFPGGAGTASLVQQARRMASRSPVPISVAEVSPAAGLWHGVRQNPDLASRDSHPRQRQSMPAAQLPASS